MDVWLFVNVVMIAGIAWLALRIFWMRAEHAGWNRGFEDGCAFVRRVAAAEKELRNVEPVILEPAEHRLLMEVLRDLVLEDHGTIH